MIDFNIKKDKSRVILRINGDLDINHAVEIKNKVAEIIGENNLEIILSKINTIDLSFIQILACLINYFNNGNKKVSIKSEESNELNNAIIELGLNNHHYFKSLYKE